MTGKIITAIALWRHTLTQMDVVAIVILLFLGLTAALCAAETFLIIGAVKSWRRGQGVPKRFHSAGAMVIHLLVILEVACLLYGHLIEPYWVEVKKVEIPTSELHQTTVRIAQISDTHCTIIPLNEKKMDDVFSCQHANH